MVQAAAKAYDNQQARRSKAYATIDKLQSGINKSEEGSSRGKLFQNLYGDTFDVLASTYAPSKADVAALPNSPEAQKSIAYAKAGYDLTERNYRGYLDMYTQYSQDASGYRSEIESAYKKGYITTSEYQDYIKEVDDYLSELNSDLAEQKKARAEGREYYHNIAEYARTTGGYSGGVAGDEYNPYAIDASYQKDIDANRDSDSAMIEDNLRQYEALASYYESIGDTESANEVRSQMENLWTMLKPGLGAKKWGPGYNTIVGGLYSIIGGFKGFQETDAQASVNAQANEANKAWKEAQSEAEMWLQRWQEGEQGAYDNYIAAKQRADSIAVDTPVDIALPGQQWNLRSQALWNASKEGLSWPQQMALSAAQSVIQQIPYIILGAVTSGAAASIGIEAAVASRIGAAASVAGMSTMAAGNYMTNANVSGFSAGDSLQEGVLMGAVEAATEYMAVGDIINLLTRPAGRAMWAQIVRIAGEEGLEEIAAEPLDYGIQLYYQDPNAEISLKSVLEAGVTGMLAGLGLGGISAGVRSVANASWKNPLVSDDEVMSAWKQFGDFTRSRAQIRKELEDTFRQAGVDAADAEELADYYDSIYGEQYEQAQMESQQERMSRPEMLDEQRVSDPVQNGDTVDFRDVLSETPQESVEPTVERVSEETVQNIPEEEKPQEINPEDGISVQHDSLSEVRDDLGDRGQPEVNQEPEEKAQETKTEPEQYSEEDYGGIEEEYGEEPEQDQSGNGVFDEIDRLGETLGENGRKALASVYDGDRDPASFFAGFAKVYNAARNGMSESEARNAVKPGWMDNPTFFHAFSSGVNDRGASEQVEEEPREEQDNVLRFEDGEAVQDHSVLSYFRTLSDDMKKLISGMGYNIRSGDDNVTASELKRYMIDMKNRKDEPVLYLNRNGETVRIYAYHGEDIHAGDIVSNSFWLNDSVDERHYFLVKETRENGLTVSPVNTSRSFPIPKSSVCWIIRGEDAKNVAAKERGQAAESDDASVGRLIMDGALTIDAFAKYFGISPHTVREHLADYTQGDLEPANRLLEAIKRKDSVRDAINKYLKPLFQDDSVNIENRLLESIVMHFEGWKYGQQETREEQAQPKQESPKRKSYIDDIHDKITEFLNGETEKVNWDRIDLELSMNLTFNGEDPKTVARNIMAFAGIPDTRGNFRMVHGWIKDISIYNNEKLDNLTEDDEKKLRELADAMEGKAAQESEAFTENIGRIISGDILSMDEFGETFDIDMEEPKTWLNMKDWGFSGVVSNMVNSVKDNYGEDTLRRMKVLADEMNGRDTPATHVRVKFDAVLRKHAGAWVEEAEKSWGLDDETVDSGEMAGDNETEASPAQETTPVPEKPSSPQQQIADKVRAYIEKGQSFSSAKLFEIADAAYGGTQAQGAYTVKDAYDGMELGVNLYLMNADWVKEANSGDTEKAAQTVERLIGLLEKLPTIQGRTKESESFQQFSTPPNIAYLAAWAANIASGDTVVEPSAGIGGLALWGKAWGAAVYGNEYSERRLEFLNRLGLDGTFNLNAEQLDNLLPESVRPTVVVMNPPFSATAGRVKNHNTANAKRHITQALDRLEPGGRLVAILGKGMADDSKTFRSWWNEMRQQYNVRCNIQINGKNYKKYGTTWDVQLVVIDKTGATEGQTVTGTYTTLDGVVDVLKEIRDDRTAVEAREEEHGRDDRDVLRDGDLADGDVRQKPAVRNGTERDGRARSGEHRGTDEAQDGGHVAGRDRGDVGRAAEGRAEDGERGDTGEVRGELRGDVSDRGGDRDGNAVSEPKKPSNKKLKDGKPQQSDDSTFSNYAPREVMQGAKPHPANLVESAAMGSVQMPPLTYTPDLPQELIESGRPSAVQLESIAYAGQAHGQLLPDGRRKGFFIGDGTGVGKGVQIASIIMDNRNKGRKRAVWITETQKLITDAERDWVDIGGSAEDITPINKTKTGKQIQKGDGILISTYDTLKGKGRVDQIVEWLGEDFDGVIAFDESHNMANCVKTKAKIGSRKPSAKALAGIDLQKRLPNARIVYASATGATEVSGLGYLERLGLWGKGTPFNSFEDFHNRIAASGLAAMELVARDMKAMGLYVARSISFHDVGYETLEHKLNGTQKKIYDTCAEAWQIVIRAFEDSADKTGMSGKDRGHMRGAFYGAQQSFFNQVITSMGMPTVIADIRKEIAAGRSCVIQLVNTNESRANSEIERIQSEGGSLDELDLSPSEMLINLIQSAYPVIQYEEYEDDNGNIRTRPVTDKDGKPVESRAAVRAREELKQRIGRMKVPDGPLEMLFDAFGEGEVAEVTGRSRRVVTVEDENGEPVRTIRKLTSNSMEADAKAFQDGKKHILVFSNAGGTGKSYHASNDAKNRQQRVHYLLQPGWVAAKAIQGLGRTHRTNQASAPIVKLVTTDVAGQKRFISTIARRMSQLGALTRGQRDAGNGMFSERDNLENPIAQDALAVWYRKDGQKFIDNLGVRDKLYDSQTGQIKNDSPALRDVPMFLNRVLALSFDDQNEAFGTFYTEFQNQMEAAIENGTADTGMENYKAEKLTVVNTTEIKENEDGTKIELLEIDAVQKTKKQSWSAISKMDKFLGVYTDKNGNAFAVHEIAPRTDPDTGEVHQYVRVMPPVIGGKRYFIPESELSRDFKRAGNDKEAWAAALEASPDTKTDKVYMLTGTLLPVWDKLPENNAKVLRMATSGGESYIGRVIPRSQLDRTLQMLGKDAASVLYGKMTAADVYDAVMKGNTVWLANDSMKLERRRVSGEYRIEITRRANMWALPEEYKGIFMEKIRFKERYFVPTGEKGKGIIRELMRGNPVRNVAESRAKQGDLSFTVKVGSRFAYSAYGQNYTYEVVEIPEGADMEDPNTYVTVSTDGRDRFRISLYNLAKLESVDEEKTSGRGPSGSRPGTNGKPKQKVKRSPESYWHGTRNEGNTEKARSLTEITQWIVDKLGIPVNTGKMQLHGAAGEYHYNWNTIRERTENDMPIISHELGHWLDDRYSEGVSYTDNYFTESLLSEAARHELVSNFEGKDNYREEEWAQEGFAEFVRQFLTSREDAAEKFPVTYEEFRSALTEEDLIVLDKLGDMINAVMSGEPDTNSLIRRRGETVDYTPLDERIKGYSDAFYYQFVDTNVAIHNLIDEAGTNDELNPYMLATNAQYAADRAGAILTDDMFSLDGTERVAEGLGSVLRKAGIDLRNKKQYRDFGEYLIVRHAPERLEEGMQIFADPRADTPQYCAERQAELEEQYPKFREAADALYNWQRTFLQEYAVKGRMVSRESADEWAERWQYYVPFYRYMGKGKGKRGAKAAKSFANQGSIIRKAKGSGRDLYHPVDNIAHFVTQMTMSAVMNDVMFNITRTVMNMDNSGVWMEKVPPNRVMNKIGLDGVKKQLEEAFPEIVQAHEAAKLEAIMEGDDSDMENPNKGAFDFLGQYLTQFRIGKPNGNIITVMNNGRPEFWQVNDEMMLNAVANMSGAQRDGFLAVLSMVTRFMTSNMTGNNVLWAVLSNGPRDLFQSFLMGKNKNPVTMIRDIGLSYVNKFLNTVNSRRTDPLYKEFLAMGGGNVNIYNADVNQNKKFYRNMLGRKWYDLVKPMAVLDLLNFIGSAVESGPRFADYKYRRTKLHESPQKAFYHAMDVTVNFRRGGKASREINKVVPFYGAGTQGIDRFARFITAEDVPKSRKAKVIAGRLIAYTSASLIIALISGALNGTLGDDDDDEERRKQYNRLSNYTKNSFFCIPEDNDGHYFCIPKNRETVVPISFFETLFEFRAGNDHAFDEFGKYVRDNCLPPVWSDLVAGDTTGAIGDMGIFGVFAYMAANRDFRGQPIVSSGLQNLEPKDQYNGRTSKMAVAIARAMNDSPIGAPDFMKSPQMVDYFFNQILGGWWKYGKALFPMDEANRDITLGFGNQILKDNQYSNDIINRLYDRVDAAEKHKNSNSGDIDAAIAYKKDYAVKSFYATYYAISRNESETEKTRGVRSAVLDIVTEYLKAAELGSYSDAEKCLDAVVRETGDTSYLPGALSATIKDSKKVEHDLSAQQYVDYQTNYNRVFWETCEAGFTGDVEKDTAVVEMAKELASNEAKKTALANIGAPYEDSKTAAGYDSAKKAGVSIAGYVAVRSIASGGEYKNLYRTAADGDGKAGTQIKDSGKYLQMDAVNRLGLDSKGRAWAVDYLELGSVADVAPETIASNVSAWRSAGAKPMTEAEAKQVSMEAAAKDAGVDVDVFSSAYDDFKSGTQNMTAFNPATGKEETGYKKKQVMAYIDNMDCPNSVKRYIYLNYTTYKESDCRW